MRQLFTSASLAKFLESVGLKGSGLASAGRFLLIFCATFLFTLPFWIRQTFGDNVNAEQLVFHMLSGIRGILGARNILYISFFAINILIPLTVASGVNVVILKLQERVKDSRLLPWPGKKLGLMNAGSITLAGAVLVASGANFVVSVGIPKYIKSFYEIDQLSQIYFHPKNIRFKKPQRQKNLIFIYVESLEYGLRETDIHQVNLIQKIDDLPGQNAKIVPAPGTGWSIAGTVASQCSVPLKPYYGNRLGGKSRFLPSLICVGDILGEQGYQQYFLTGPKVGFSGMDTFYESHGFQFAIGRDQWIERGVSSSLFTGWGEGIHDDTLFVEAKAVVAEAQKSDQPYNITIMTTDNHSPDGTPSPRCDDSQYLSGYRHAFKCSSLSVSTFIEELMAAKMLENTLVIIMGDHPFMATPELSMYFPNPRYVYFKVFNSDMNLKREKMTHFDVAPTILHGLGVLDTQVVKFGLGMSNFVDVAPLEYDDHFKKITHESIINHSLLYDSFWLPK